MSIGTSGSSVGRDGGGVGGGECGKATLRGERTELLDREGEDVRELDLSWSEEEGCLFILGLPSDGDSDLLLMLSVA